MSKPDKHVKFKSAGLSLSAPDSVATPRRYSAVAAGQFRSPVRIPVAYLKRSKVAQALIDIFALIVGIFLACVFAVAVGGSLFILLFDLI